MKTIWLIIKTIIVFGLGYVRAWLARWGELRENIRARRTSVELKQKGKG